PAQSHTAKMTLQRTSAAIALWRPAVNDWRRCGSSQATSDATNTAAGRKNQGAIAIHENPVTSHGFTRRCWIIQRNEGMKKSQFPPALTLTMLRIAVHATIPPPHQRSCIASDRHGRAG